MQLVPVAGPPVQGGDLVGAFVQEACQEDVAEQVVVAVPLPPVVERDKEQVAALERLQRRVALCSGS